MIGLTKNNINYISWLIDIILYPSHLLLPIFMIFYVLLGITNYINQGVIMQKRTKIIIGISIAVAIALIIGLIIFFHKRGDSSEPNDSESSTTEENVDETEDPSTEDENLASKDDTEDESDTNETESTNTVTIDANVSLKEVNSWESEGNIYVQVDGTISNNSNSVIDNWEARVPIDSSAVINDSWNMNFELDNGLLSITGVDHNESIPANSSVNFGMIIINAGELDSTKAKLIVQGETLPSDVDEENDPKETKATKNSNNSATLSKPAKGSTNDDWLYTDGNKILDKNGKEVWLTGLNWFGYNTGTNTFDGLWTCDLNTSLSQIADRGFNIIRIPFSSELILQWKKGEYPKANYNEHVNSYLNDKNSLEIFDYVVEQCRANGIKIMIDIHSAETDPSGHMAPLWYSNKISEADYLDSLSWMANRYKNDDTIIAYDLKNEPHGAAGESTRAIWNDSKDSNNWKHVAEKAALAVLSKNPNALVLVEGIQIYPKNIKTNKDYSSKNDADYHNTWWGGNLRGVKDFPVELGKHQNKLVYSPHDYGPAVYAQPWFNKSFTMDSLYKDAWRDNWMYIHDDDIAPILIGEWGGFMSSPNLKWMTYLRDFIIKHKLHHTFWCFNANSGDTGGLVLDDFTTWDEEKYAFVKKALWQKNGKFVGLDHEIPLGSNGISLSEY